MQQSDLGVYHCTLFRETGCLLAYKRIELHNVDFQWPWMIIAGAAVGGAVLLVLVIITMKVFKRQTVIHRSHNSNESNDLVHDNLINGSTEDSGHVSSDTVLYATVKERT
ncbi:hypothetical protein G5714_005592 [Onychostoma macrolepis]|uniref:Uncharacterized protein n=1 Tax=Onychostoma macrolepis TaxID=369639 RepID=A0A7J6D1G1_9TELE|nr:hypothetical protein G5714_005592 [Onychostoma macrolepis]